MNKLIIAIFFLSLLSCNESQPKELNFYGEKITSNNISDFVKVKNLTESQAEVETKTEEENQTRAQEVQSIQESIRQYQGQAQQDLQTKETGLMKPIFEKAKAAIDKVAKAQGFEYVLNSVEGSGVLVANGKDLLPDVKKELGL